MKKCEFSVHGINFSSKSKGPTGQGLNIGKYAECPILSANINRGSADLNTPLDTPLNCVFMRVVSFFISVT